MGQEQDTEAEIAFRREAARLERALATEAADERSDEELRVSLDRLGDLFLTMTRRPVPTSGQQGGAELSPSADAR